ncbi:WG repeat-containing protein [Lutimonas sp.]|uniref:WG repeat-containing protein n=1 Tax=Lutimonas sp. TaxID=1872403 RepID=UPI003D9BFB44
MKTAITFAFAFMMCISMNAQLLQDLDHIENFNEGLAAIQKGDQWAFIDQQGQMIVDFRKDIALKKGEKGAVTLPKFSNERTIITAVKEGIHFYGYIDKTGKTVIECQYVNATVFANGFALVMQYSKEVVGKNNLLGKDVVSYQIEEYVIDSNGKALTAGLNPRNYVPSKMKSGEAPDFTTHFIGERMIAVQGPDQKWDIYSF